VVREVKGIEKMSMLGAGRGARERGGRRLEVEVNAKRRSPSHYVGRLGVDFGSRARLHATAFRPSARVANPTPRQCVPPVYRAPLNSRGPRETFISATNSLMSSA
jgi:hypothetical protein